MKFRKGSRRNTQCYEVVMFGVCVSISYETPIAYTYDGESVRRTNDWGRTTGRHMSEMGLYAEYFEVEPDGDRFNDRLERTLERAAITQLERRMGWDKKAA